MSAELAAVSEKFATPRRTVLLEGTGAARTAAVPLEVADEPCTVLLSSAGLLARTAARPATGGQGTLPTDDEDGERGSPPSRSARGSGGQRAAHDVIVSSVSSTARGTIGVVTSAGRLIRLGVLELPALPPSAHSPALSGGAPVSEFVTTGPGETVVAIVAADADGAGLALGTAQGVVKRVAPDYPQNAADFEVIALKDGDRVVGAVQLDRRGPGADVHHQRCPAAAVPGVGGAAAGPGRERDGGHPALAASQRDLVRRGRPGRRGAGRGLRRARPPGQ